MPKNQIQFIVDEVKRPIERKLTILMTSTHPMTDTNICKTGHEFYNLNEKNFPIKWQAGLPVPPNMHIINSIGELPHRPDLIISQNVVDQYQAFKQLSYYFDCPLVEFEHTLPTEQWVKGGTLDIIKREIRTQGYVFISEFSRKEWQQLDNPVSKVIYHMVDSDIYSGWEGGNRRAMMLVNAFRGREWAVGNVAEYMMLSDKLDLFGNNPGFNSESLNNAQVIQRLREYDVFVNTSLRSPIPASLLEAASIGIPILSTKTCAIPEFFKDTKSIVYFDSQEDFKCKLEILLTNKEIRKEIGAGGREVILNHFNQNRYVEDWNNVLNSALEIYNGQ